MNQTLCLYQTAGEKAIPVSPQVTPRSRSVKPDKILFVG